MSILQFIAYSWMILSGLFLLVILILWGIGTAIAANGKNVKAHLEKKTEAPSNKNWSESLEYVPSVDLAAEIAKRNDMVVVSWGKILDMEEGKVSIECMTKLDIPLAGRQMMAEILVERIINGAGGGEEYVAE